MQAREALRVHALTTWAQRSMPQAARIGQRLLTHDTNVSNAHN
jgi:hypothetical protein